MTKSIPKLNLMLICCEANLSFNENCRCRYIKTLQNSIKKYVYKLNNLPSFSYNQKTLGYESINSFQLSDKKNNDKNNKLRENIIGAIINDKVPTTYFQVSQQWKCMKKKVFEYISSLVPDIQIHTIFCEHKGGRMFNYDFMIVINGTTTFHIELKFNSSTILEAPQFVSPMKPSQYLSSSYEEYFYDNYIIKLSEFGELDIPNKEEYLQEIHYHAPKCMVPFQNKYYKGCLTSSQFTNEEKDILFYKKANNMSKQSITDFINNTELDIQKLSEYLIKTQQNKYYMMYKDNNFYKQTVNMDEYELVSYKKEKNRFVATSKTGNKIKILLRWKNGNGIAFPAFQIS